MKIETHPWYCSSIAICQRRVAKHYRITKETCRRSNLATLLDALLCFIQLNSNLLNSFLPYATLLYCTLLYCTLLYCTLLYCTPPHGDGYLGFHMVVPSRTRFSPIKHEISPAKNKMQPTNPLLLYLCTETVECGRVECKVWSAKCGV